jgi:hypothetical protein
MCIAICKLFSLVFVCLVGVNLGRKRQQHWRSSPGMFEKLMKAAKGKQVAVFLDYDGTLSPIVEDPDKAYMSPDVRL